MNDFNTSNTAGIPDFIAPEGLPPKHRPLLLIVALCLLVIVGLVFMVLFRQKPVPPSLGVDKNGVPIINLNKKQVVERVSNSKPLNEPEVRAVFRWAVEHPNEAARLSAKEKANIIKALNE